MGVPALFRWLSNKYPKIVSAVIEEQPTIVDDEEIPVDATKPNPNGQETDNLYLDMNGIVHPCTHPEGKPPPANEAEMMVEVFRYTDRVVKMARPRKLLMIAVDGVAPRAKMNQQRSRRFRSAQDAKEADEKKQEFQKLLAKQSHGKSEVLLEEGVKKTWDSNVITPGTPFMDILAASLQYWVKYKLNTDPAWQNLKVIISDATVPGEGEHKIMNFIRSQRSMREHDPNTHHVIYGLDADLIMLALATHEPHFRVLREDVFFQESKAQMCKLCGQKGHVEQSCTGKAKEKNGEHDEKDKIVGLKPFIWLHVPILREYLAIEMKAPRQPFPFNLENALDDWVFMCFFVGNDFLPHLPSLDVKENGIDTLLRIWRDSLPAMGGYLTQSGRVHLKRAQIILQGLAKQESAIFQKRQKDEERRGANQKRRKDEQERRAQGNQARRVKPTNDSGDLNNIALLRNQGNKDSTHGAGSKRAIDETDANDVDKEPETKRQKDVTGEPKPNNDDGAPIDTVRLWEEGYEERYYEQKFHVDPSDITFRRKVAAKYAEGLSWVLEYYFQGCPSWTWYFPYHYAPFAADFVDIGNLNIKFVQGKPFKPYEQLMGVLPATSSHAIPEVFHSLMTDDNSEIIDFYPEEFPVDLNGKKFAWQGVALLPFIDEHRLLEAMGKRYHLLSEAELLRNEMGRDRLFFSDRHPMYEQIAASFYSKKKTEGKLKLDMKLSKGLGGAVSADELYVPHSSLTAPVEGVDLPELEEDHSIVVLYFIPKSHGHKSMLLPGAKLPPPVLDGMDIDIIRSKAMRGGGGIGGGGPNRGGGRGGGGRGGGFPHPSGVSRGAHMGGHNVVHQSYAAAAAASGGYNAGYPGGHRGGYNGGYGGGGYNGSYGGGYNGSYGGGYNSGYGGGGGGGYNGGYGGGYPGGHRGGGYNGGGHNHRGGYHAGYGSGISHAPSHYPPRRFDGRGPPGVAAHNNPPRYRGPPPPPGFFSSYDQNWGPRRQRQHRG